MWPHLVNMNFIIWLVAGRPFSGFRLYFTLNGITHFIKFNFRGPSLRISNKTKKLTRNVRPRRFDGNWVFEYYSSIISLAAMMIFVYIYRNYRISHSSSIFRYFRKCYFSLCLNWKEKPFQLFTTTFQISWSVWEIHINW